MADADAPPVEARPADDDLESDDEWPDVSDHEGSRDDGDDASGDEIDISPVATGGRSSAPPPGDARAPAEAEPDPSGTQGQPGYVSSRVEAVESASPRAEDGDAGPATASNTGPTAFGSSGGWVETTGSVGALFGGADDGEDGAFGPGSGYVVADAPAFASPTKSAAARPAGAPATDPSPFGAADGDDDFFSALASPKKVAPTPVPLPPGSSIR